MSEMGVMGPIVAIIAIVFAFGSPILLVGCILFYKQRKHRLTHETILKLAEKGTPIPPELLVPPSEKSSDLRRGLVLFFIGLALAIFLAEVGAPWSIGLIPMFAGLGYLIAWKMEGKDSDAPQEKAAQHL
jgi:hypothetical protein